MTSNTVILGEAKWLSGVGAKQGKARDKDQIRLCGEFLAKYGQAIFPDRTHKVVLGIGLLPDAFKDTTPEGVDFITTLWRDICFFDTHPLCPELNQYYSWKLNNSILSTKTDTIDNKITNGEPICC